MTDRGRSPVDASVACPFVAFEDDRDARSDAPDPRHRCFAELRPAPRAIAHQQAYCLSSGFAACPTFTDWAHREAARVRSEPAPRRASASAGLGLAAEAGELASAGSDVDREAAAADEPVWPRRSEREWAAPPPWGVDHGPAEAPVDEGPPPPPFLASSGAEDVAGRPGRGADRPDRAPGQDRAPGPDRGSRGGGYGPDESPSRSSSRSDAEAYDDRSEATEEPPMRRFTPDARRAADRRMAERRDSGAEAPSWETPRRYEAYPTLRPPRSVRSLSPLVLAVGALIVGALALFFIPPLLLGLGGPSSSPTPSPSPSSVAASSSPDASPSPSAAVTIYTVKSGDTMSTIAKKFNVSLDQLIAANKATVKDPNKIAIGDQLVIPKPGSASGEIQAASPSPSP